MQGQNDTDVNQQVYNVPINESLKEIIPFDQKIVLSTYISVIYNIAKPKGAGIKHGALTFLLTGSAVGAIVTSNMASSFHGFYYTDALATKEGLALNLPSFYWVNNGKKMKRKQPNPKYISWRKIDFPSTRGLQGSFEIDLTYKCHLIHNKSYGSREQFNVHKEHFFKCIPKIRDECVMQHMKKAQLTRNLDKMLLENVSLFVLNYLQGHPRKAFTYESLMKRLKTEIDSQEWLDCLEKYLKRILDRFLFTGEIEFNEHEGRLFYFSSN
jgi:hypothetical protein